MTDLERLRRARSLSDLARILSFTPKGLAYILYVAPPASKYRTFEIPKANGGVRQIHAPTDALKLAQKNLANLLYSCREELEAESQRHPISHGFRRRHSIITNAAVHTGRRYVLNVDLADFFPTFNFGRVRGFFIKDRGFALEPEVATVIAQIACWQNSLPQGSPSSPIVSDLIAHILDVRLVGLAKANKVSYSRYADDLTFSTSRKGFPPALAAPSEASGTGWALGDRLVGSIERCGFFINPSKVRMQTAIGRQAVTGLTVNKKVNVPQDYYRHVRAMCHSLFSKGRYFRPISSPEASEASQSPEPIVSLDPLEGMLSHVYHVKRSADFDEYGVLRSIPAQGTRNLYRRFLFYRHFVAPTKPLVVCEGKTDNIYLRFALRYAEGVPEGLCTKGPDGFSSAIRFFNYSNKMHYLSGVTGGVENLKKMIADYPKMMKQYRHRPIEHPVIVLIDNDDGASNMFSLLNKITDAKCDKKTTDRFYYVHDNLYVVKTPEIGVNGDSCVESFFDDEIKSEVLGGKTFNANNKIDSDTEYGKKIFAERVVTPTASKIDWSRFIPLLERLAAVVVDYEGRTRESSEKAA